MKRALIVATTAKAGMGPYVSEIVNTFNGEDTNVYFLFNEDNGAYFKKNIKPELIKQSSFYTEKKNICGKIRKLTGIGLGTFGKFIYETCLELKIDVIHFINGCENVRLLEKLKKASIEVIVTVHDLLPHELNGTIKERIIQKIIHNRISYSIEASDKLITNSRIQYEELKKIYPTKKVLFHEFPSLVSKEVSEGNDSITELSKLTDYILFFGRIEAYKGVEYLCDAFSCTPELYCNTNLVIAGKGELKMKKEWKNKNIIFLNRYIKDSEIGSLYKHARVVVYPYISATQSGVLSLAFYYQIPVLTSDIPYFKTIIERTRTGITFKNRDSIDLSFKLLKLLSENQDRIRERQKDFYSQCYTSNSIGTELLIFYDL